MDKNNEHAIHTLNQPSIVVKLLKKSQEINIQIMPKLFNKAKVNSIRTLEAISGFLKIV
jgi:hypothetical protein